MFSTFDFDVIWRSLPYLFYQGMVFTLTLTAIATFFGLILGTLIAMMRLSSNAVLSGIAASYVNLMRSLPLVLVIFLFYFLSPYIGQWIIQADQPVQVGANTSTIITFTLFEAAYFAEIMRAGIQSVPRGQVMAGYAVGFNYREVMRYVVLPQAFRNMLPVIFTQTIVLFQDTSLVYVLSITDFLGAASKVAQRDGRLTEMYLFAAVVYFAISFTASFFVKRLQSASASSASQHGCPHAHDHPRQSQQVVQSAVSGVEELHDASGEGRGRRRLRSIGLGQVDTHQDDQRAGAGAGRHHYR